MDREATIIYLAIGWIVRVIWIIIILPARSTWNTTCKVDMYKMKSHEHDRPDRDRIHVVSK